MRQSAARGRKVVSMATAATVGRVGGVVVDARAGRVVALRLRKTGTRATMLPWGNIHGLGDDAVTVTDADRIIEPDPELTELAGKPCAVLGKKVLSTDGAVLGQVRDIDLDTATGAVVSLVLADREIAGDRMVGAGPFAVVVRADRVAPDGR